MHRFRRLFPTLLVLFGCGTSRTALFEEYEAVLDTIQAPSAQVRFDTPPYAELVAGIKDLPKEDLDTLLALELARLAPGSFIVGKGGRTLPRSVNMGARTCGTFDDADRSAIKSYNKSGLYLPKLASWQHILPVDVHVITRDSLQISPATTERLKEQIAVLNAAFAPIRIAFELNGTYRHVNAAWYGCHPSTDPVVHAAYISMVDSLARNANSIINVFVKDLPDYGQAPYPWSTTYQTTDDVILLRDSTLPGLVLGNQDMLGKTLIHEMGHFMGLFHTYNDTMPWPCDSIAYNGCSVGDDVDDTPPQKICHFYGCGECSDGRGYVPCEDPALCFTGKGCLPCGTLGSCDTCAGDTLPDPVTNYMGTNPDPCMDHFTPGQYMRMELFFYTRRRYFSREVVANAF